MEKTRLEAVHGPGNAIEQALGRDIKGKASIATYVLGTLAAWWINPWVGFAAFACVALLWLVPDRRMEQVALQNRNHRT